MFLLLEVRKQVLKDDWANGVFTSSDHTGTLQLNSEAIGKVVLLQELSDLSYEQLIEEIADAK